jgi:hypothetical protein
MKSMMVCVLLFILVFIAAINIMPSLGFGNNQTPQDQQAIQTPFQEFPGLIEV